MKLFANRSVKNDQEFTELLKINQRNYLVLGVAALLVIVGVNIAKPVLGIQLSSNISGYLSGFGTSLLFAAAVLWWRNRRLLADKQALHRERIKVYDERNIELQKYANRIAGAVLVLVVAALAFFGFFFDERLGYIASGLMYLYAFTYLATYLYARKKK